MKNTNAQLILPLMPDTLKSFELFYPGKNQIILDTLKAKDHPQFIYLFGLEGSGKSHLLEAYANQALKTNQRILFLPLKNLSTNKDYLKDWPKLDAILIDDLELLPKDLEVELFHNFNKLQADNTSLIVSSTKSPQQIDIQLPDLKSRLNSGLALNIELLKDQDLKAALQLKAKQLGLKLDNKIYDFLLNHLDRNLANLNSQLKQISEYSLRTKRPVTLPLIKQALNAR